MRRPSGVAPPGPANWLLAHGAKTERMTTQGTALHLAVWQGHTNTVRLLLANDANPRARSPRLFEDSWWTPLHAAAVTGRVEIARLLLDRGVAVDIEDSIGHTPLHLAVRDGEHSVAMVKLLLGHKANARAATKFGQEPLHFAAEAGNTRAVALLLDHKADVNAREKKEGKTPLHLAVEAHPTLDDLRESLALPVVQLLLERKADTTIKDHKGRTPLALAVEMKYAKVVQLLRKYGAKK
jgi:ankyrin